jgi:hypothetical protein
VSALPGWQLPPASQQPSGQLAALQAAHPWLMHALFAPAVQLTHAAALAPHAVWSVPTRQVMPSQQPSGQVRMSHPWHILLMQFCPGTALQSEHRSPASPQKSLVSPS